MIVLKPLSRAQIMPLTEITALARIRISRSLTSGPPGFNPLEKSLHKVFEVPAVILVQKDLFRAVPQHHPHVPWISTLYASQDTGIKGKLNHEPGPGTQGKLGIDYFVAVPARQGRS